MNTKTAKFTTKTQSTAEPQTSKVVSNVSSTSKQLKEVKDNKDSKDKKEEKPIKKKGHLKSNSNVQEFAFQAERIEEDIDFKYTNFANNFDGKYIISLFYKIL